MGRPKKKGEFTQKEYSEIVTMLSTAMKKFSEPNLHFTISSQHLCSLSFAVHHFKDGEIDYACYGVEFSPWYEDLVEKNKILFKECLTAKTTEEFIERLKARFTFEYK